MAVLGRVLFSSAERVDLPDLLSIDSYAAGDWKYFLQSIVGTSKPYILTGFDVINPEAAIGVATCSIRVADSVVYYPGSAAGPFFYGLPEGASGAEPLVPELRTNAVNYVYLTLSTFHTASDTRALWDPDRNGGVGAEFTQDINTESVIRAQVNVSTGSFPANTIPVAIITVGPSTILSIQDARDMLFRLGTGGLNPNPLNTYSFRDLPSSLYSRSEPDTTISNFSDPNPFQGGDKNIHSLKEWMDVVMTKLKEIGGTKYWYETTETLSLGTLFQDALATSWKSKGSYTHSSATAGRLSWSEDIYIKSTTSPKDVVIRASGANPLDIGNEQVAFIELIRGQRINTLDMPVMFTNGQAYINTIDGSVGLFQNLKKGDWIKKSTDADTLFLQVREFYNTTQSPGPVAGAVTTPAAARSVMLSGPYQGSTSQPTGDRARYDRGEYLATDIQIVDRDDPTLTAAGANNLWFALRSDTVMAISAISASTVSGTIATADGNGVTVSATAHGMVDGDRITVASPAIHAGTYTVDVIDANTFNIKSTNTTTGAFTGYYGLASTTSTSVNGFQLESANHGLDSGETVTISSTTAYNGTYVVNVRSATVFQFPLSSFRAIGSTGTVTLARMDVRSEEGINKLIQGETIDIGGNTTDNIRAFIGMSSPDQVAPVYNIPSGYNTLNSGANYNGLLTDSLTARLSKSTAMHMNKAQDKNIRLVTSAVEATNTASGALRNLSFVPPSSTLTIVQPGSPGNATVTLPSAGAPLQLSTNQCAYVTINRNASSTPGVVISSISAVPVDENIFVIATRLTDEYVHLWNGTAVRGTVPLAPSDVPLVQVTCYDPVSTVRPTGSPVSVDGQSVAAGDTVLFSNLTVGKNSIYRAVGVGANITGWDSALYAFHDSQTPSVGDTIIVRRGTAFGLQVGKFDGTSWLFNDKVRYFNGTDYWEQSNILSSTVDDGVTGTLINVPWLGNEHMVINYSVVRSTNRETGTMHVVTDGTSASLSTNSTYLNGNIGVTFNARISGSTLVVEYVSAATGQTGTMKYMVQRWASGSGGPAGVPVYSGAAPAPTAAGGPVGSMQFNSGGAITGNPNFLIDTVDLSMNLNGLRQGVLSSSIALAASVPSWVELFSMPDSMPFIVMEYSVTKEGHAKTGRALVACAGANVSFSESSTQTGPTLFEIQVVKVGSNIQFQYRAIGGTTTGSFKYSWRKWS